MMARRARPSRRVSLSEQRTRCLASRNRCRRSVSLLGIDSRTASGKGAALDLRRRAASGGHRRHARDAPRARRDGHVLPRWRAGGSRPGSRGRGGCRGPRDSAPLRPPPQPAPAHPAAGERRPRSRDGPDRVRDRGLAGTSPAAVRGVLRRGPVCGPSPRARPLLRTHWGHDWSRRSTPRTRLLDEITDDLLPGSVLLLHDSDAYASEGSWRQHRSGTPRVLDRIAAAGLAPEAP